MEMLHRLDWSLLQTFLAVAEEGSLSGAARRLGASQPTVGRQVKAAEQQLGVALFQRRARGVALTETGAALVAPARSMAEAAQQIALTAAGRDTALSGTVRITASMIISSAHLPPIIAGLRRSEPEIEIELVPSDTTSNLLYREADIALRMFRPRQLDLVTLHLGDIALGTFAARSYVARHGLPRRPDEMAAHDVVGFDRDPAILEGFAQMGVPVTRSFFPVRCDDNLVYWELVRAGCGIGFAQREMGLADPDLVEIDLGLPLPTLPVWLTAHEAMRETPRLRRVWRALQEGLAPLVS